MYSRILLAFDESNSSRAALGEAARLARLAGGVVHVVYVADKAPAYPFTVHYDLSLMNQALHRHGRMLLGTACGELARLGVAYETEIVDANSMSEDIASCLQRHAQSIGAEIVVMGSHGRSGVPHAVLGSVAERFVREAPCPVMVVKEAVQAAAPEPSCSNF
ncbi:universal stress protein [Paraburkholderia sp. HD33-4]|uniref:universal stress protein n=1 Tax=Paraburkholderia sp. HD33-4 TaxID=2883242 RepID=UPI001F2633BA|nr:universal stress protein [Paraburkholderia sp. HD33-4]